MQVKWMHVRPVFFHYSENSSIGEAAIEKYDLEKETLLTKNKTKTYYYRNVLSAVFMLFSPGDVKFKIARKTSTLRYRNYPTFHWKNSFYMKE